MVICMVSCMWVGSEHEERGVERKVVRKDG